MDSTFDGGEDSVARDENDLYEPSASNINRFQLFLQSHFNLKFKIGEIRTLNTLGDYPDQLISAEPAVKHLFPRIQKIRSLSL